jgi:lipopolysaccharide export system protein LptC
MGLGFDGYTRFVTVTKVVLPLIAIGLLGTVFLFTNDDNLEGGFTFSKADLDTLDSGMRIVKPRMFGSNPNGDVYNFVADALLPDSLTPSLVEAQKISGEIQYQTGGTVQLSAGKAEFMLEGNQLRLSGGMLVVMSEGHRVTGDGLLAELDSGKLTSNGAVSATSPLGNIQAGNFRVELVGEDDEEKQMIWFENGVMLSFKPESWTKEEATTE